jgi:hypothetical protein
MQRRIITTFVITTTLALAALGCGDEDKAESLTPLQRLRRAQAAAPQLPPPPPPLKAPQIGQNESIGSECPMPGEDSDTCPKAGGKPSQSVTAAHVLIGWRGSLPGQAPDRSEHEAAVLTTTVVHQARTKRADFMALVHTHSDDTGIGVHTLDKRSQHRFVKPYVKAARGLQVGQVAVAKSRFGFHVIKRMNDGFVPPPRPLEQIITGDCPRPDEDPSACPQAPAKSPAKVVVEHILIGYKGSLTRRRDNRAEAAARSLAIDLTHRARRKGANFGALRTAHSDDPSEGAYTVTPGSVLEPSFMRRALGLSPGNVAAVRSRFGYHVMRRRE